MTIKNAKMVLLYGFIAITFITAIIVLLANIGIFGEEVRKGDFAKWGMGAVLGEIVMVMIIFFKQSFVPTTKIKINLEFPKDAIDVDLDRQNCFYEMEKNGKTVRGKITPMLTQGWQVALPPEIQASDDEIRLILQERDGTKWEAWFYANVIKADVTKR